MGIRTDDCVTCYNQTFFRKECMLDSHLSYVKIVGDIMTTGKFTTAFAVFRRLDILIRDKMIHNQRNFVMIEYRLVVHLLHLIDRYRRCDIISKNQIQICFDQLSCFYLCKTRVRCQDLLCHCHSHDLFPPAYTYLVTAPMPLLL